MTSANRPGQSASSRQASANIGTVASDFGTVASKTGRFPSLPANAWARIQVLFFALVSIKLILILGLRKHLYEIHWRVSDEEASTLGKVAFYVFVGLGVLSLVDLGRRCQAVGLRALRAANFAVLGLGLLFVFFNFHTGDKNYLFPILVGTLKWHSLGPYLSLDLFFRPPYLGAWLFGYALAYYLLARAGRETWTFLLTILCMGAYALLYLRELAVFRNELLLADGLGIVTLVVARLSGGKLRLSWLLAPLGWSLIFALGLFYLAAPHETESMNYFLTLLSVGTFAFAVATWYAWRRGYLASWSNVLFFYFASFLLLANSHYPMAANYNNSLCLGLEFPRYFIGELAIAVVASACLGLYCQLWPRARLWWFDLLSLTLIAIAFVDLRLSQIMGVRLDWDLLMFGNSPKMMWRMAKPYLPGVMLAFFVVIVLYALAVRGVEFFNRRSRARAEVGASRTGAWYAFASFVVLGVLGLLVATSDKAEGQSSLQLAKSSPVWKRVAHRRLDRQEFIRSAKVLGLGDFASPANTPPDALRRDLNVVLIFMESSFNKHLSLFGGGEETQPLLSKYKDRMEVFPNFFSNFAGSIQARFASFTSLYPVRDFNKFTRDRVNVKSVFEALHDNGYSCSLFYSSYFDYTGFGDFLRQRGIDEMYDADTMPGRRRSGRISWGLQEEETLGAMRSQIARYASSGQRFFLTYVPAAPHYPYDSVPAAFRKYKVGEFGDFTPSYLNELLYIDSVLAGLVDQLKESGLLEKTIVIITDDHGEMTGEKGGAIGHGWVVTPELANAPLIIMDPERTGYRVNATVGSQVDLLPTILDLLKIPLPARQLYQGRSLYDVEGRTNRLAYLNSYEQYGVVDGRHVVIGSRKAEEAGNSASPRKGFVISNQGSKTLFNESHLPATQPVAIRDFDAFQENFLRDYSFYCESMHGDRAANSQVGK